MNKKYINHIIMTVLSSICLGVGCSFLIRGQIGSDALTTLMEGLANAMKTTSSVTNIIINLTSFIAALLVNRKNVGPMSLIYPFTVSVGISLGLDVIPSVLSIGFRVIYFVLGFMMLVLAIGLNSKCECGKNPYDALCFGIQEKLDINYSSVRTFFDFLMLVLGILLKGSYGIGTIICVFGIGRAAAKLIEYLNTNELYRKLMLLDY